MAGTPQQQDNLATVIRIATPTMAEPESDLSQSLPTKTNVAESSFECRKPREHRESETSAQSLPPPVIPHSHQRPPLNRGQSQIQMALNGSANFVGWNDTDGDIRRCWGSKRLRFLAKKYNLNQRRALTEEVYSLARSIDPGPHYDVVDHPGLSAHDGNQPYAQSTMNADTNFAHPYQYGPGASNYDVATPSSIGRSLSQASESHARPRAERRESVARLAYGSFANVAKRGLASTPRLHRVRLSSRQSFDMDFSESDRAGSPSSLESGQATEVPISEITHQTGIGTCVIGEDFIRRTRSAIAEESPSEMSSLEQESVMGVKQRTAAKPCVSFPEEFEMLDINQPSPYVTASEESSPEFIDADEEGSTPAPPKPKLTSQEAIDTDDLFFAFSVDDEQRSRSTRVEVEDRPSATTMSLPKMPRLFLETGSRIYRGGISRLDIGDARLHISQGKVSLGPVLEEDRAEVSQPDRPLVEAVKPFGPYLPRYPLLKQASVVETSKRGIVEGVLLNLGHQSGKLFLPRYRRYRGIGALSTFYDGSLHREKIDALNPELRDVIEKGSDERPFFTWWVTSVQMLVCIVSLLFYGLGPAGWERVEMKEEVVDVSLALRQADLIRLGAKYSPCMRREPGLWRLIDQERVKENATGCCVFNDRTGCYQTGQSSCPRTLATWHKWSHPKLPAFKKSMSESFLGDLEKNENEPTVSRRRGSLTSAITSHTWRTAGAVCGQDPDFCIRPSSVRPYEWPDDLTRWPICEQHRQGGFLPPHMTCQVTGHPCCIQMQGQCRIATREYCAFVKGHFHENATLCSQVNCFSDICGMLPFLWRDRPDQFYRMFFSLFLHAGIIHLAFTIWVQMWLMLDLEMLIGWKRMAILYIGSGVGGNFASAIFVPYSPEVGPSGSHLGIMAALVIDLYHHRSIIVRPQWELVKHLCTVLLLFLTGLLPWVDNWAHLFGFLFGLLISIVTFPYLDFQSNKELKQGCRSSLSRRNLAIVMSLVTCVFLYVLLGYIYFNSIEVNCPWCQYFNCINIRFITGSNHFCDNTGQKLSQWLPI